MNSLVLLIVCVADNADPGIAFEFIQIGFKLGTEI